MAKEDDQAMPEGNADGIPNRILANTDVMDVSSNRFTSLTREKDEKDAQKVIACEMPRTQGLLKSGASCLPFCEGKKLDLQMVGKHIESAGFLFRDRERLSQVFQNLMGYVVTHCQPTAIEIRLHDTNDSIILSITSEGTPILEEHRSNIFRFGMSPKKSNKDHGLSLVQKVLAAHGWMIHLEDIKQTTFQITIPKE